MKNECTRARDLIAAQLDGDLRAPQERELERHLALCSGCRGHLRRLRRSLAILEALPRPEPSPAFVATTLRKARLACQAQQLRRWRLARFGSLATIALAAVVVAVVRVSGLWKEPAQWLLSVAPAVVHFGEKVALGARSAWDGLVPIARGLFLGLTDTLDPLLRLLTHAAESAWSLALPGYALAIATLSFLAALSWSRSAAGPVQVEKMS
jgi:anti-sigma factor RsiW